MRPLHAGICAVLLAASCAGGTGPRLSEVVRSSRSALVFDYGATDGSRLSSSSTLGRVTAIALITTYDLPSQVLLRELVDALHTHEPRINVGAIVLEPPKNAPLVETFASALELTFPVVLADPPTLEGRGPFGAIDLVPTLVVLDSSGAEAFRHAGVLSPAELQAALERASRGVR